MKNQYKSSIIKNYKKKKFDSAPLKGYVAS